MDSIWILDDEVQARKDMARLLTKLGYAVTAFSDSQQLESAVNSLPMPTVILMDIALTGYKNGFQVAADITARYSAFASRIIFMTGWITQFSEVRPELFRQNAILDKGNWTLEELTSTIKRVAHDAPADDSSRNI
jgi:CheY-like chemotaxis protein